MQFCRKYFHFYIWIINFWIKKTNISLKFQAPYATKQVNLSISSFYTNDYSKYQNIWQIADIRNTQILTLDKYPTSFLTIQLKRNVKNYLFTLPSYVVYMLTLLMFILPQTSNQRILIGSTCLIIATILTFTMSKNMPRSDISAWPLLGIITFLSLIFKLDLYYRIYTSRKIFE